jgi:predicted ATPase
VPRRLKLIWEEEALDDLAAAAEWSRLQASHVIDAMESMAEIGPEGSGKTAFIEAVLAAEHGGRKRRGPLRLPPG